MFLMVLVIFSCREETSMMDTTTVPVGEETNFNVDIYGQVFTATGEPIDNAFVTGDNKSVYTDENGLFLLEDVQAGNLGTQISAIKDGFLYGGFRVYADDEGRNRVDIVLMQANDLGDVDTSVGATLNITDNTTVTFPVGAFTLDGTNRYDGNVNVFGNWIDPTSEDLIDLSPGDLSGVDSENNRVILSSYGMIGIELRTDSGEKLEILDGMTATLEFELPSAILSSAPSEIPLWSFDEIEGIWIEEGMATLQGNKYVGEVEHFSWWNCDLPNAIIPFCIEVYNPLTGSVLSNTRVYFKSVTGFGQAGGYTNERGFLCGFLPEGIEMTVTIGDPFLCHGQLPTKTVGPFTLADVPLNIDCPVDLTNDLVINTISGTVTDCTNGNPVENAFVLFNGIDGVLTDADGNYSLELISCEDISDLEVRAIDVASEKEASLTLTDLTGGSYTADLSLCDDLVIGNWFISSTSGTVTFDQVEAKVKPNETIIYVVDNLGEIMGIECMTTGSCSGSYVGSVGAFTIDVDVAEFGNVGQAITGTFSGTDSNGDAITGSFTADRVE